jgi:hypothetical protein
MMEFNGTTPHVGPRVGNLSWNDLEELESGSPKMPDVPVTNGHHTPVNGTSAAAVKCKIFIISRSSTSILIMYLRLNIQSMLDLYGTIIKLMRI